MCLVGDSGVWGLKKNFALLELLERLQNGASNQTGMAEDALKGMGEVESSAAESHKSNVNHQHQFTGIRMNPYRRAHLQVFSLSL